jgi:hypothetical protein
MALKITGVKDRDGFVVGEAIAAIEGMSRLPSAYRPAGKIADLKNILSDAGRNYDPSRRCPAPRRYIAWRAALGVNMISRTGTFPSS